MLKCAQQPSEQVTLSAFARRRHRQALSLLRRLILFLCPYCSLGGDTAMPGWLHAGLCHAFLAVYLLHVYNCCIYTTTNSQRIEAIEFERNALQETAITRNAWQSLAYSPLGAVVSPPSEYL